MSGTTFKIVRVNRFGVKVTVVSQTSETAGIQQANALKGREPEYLFQVVSATGVVVYSI